MRISLFALFLAAAVPAFAQDAAKPAPSGSYVSDPAHTSLTWKISHFGLSNYTARFTGVNATLDWNAERPERSALAVSVDPHSVRTDFPFPDVEDFDKDIATAPHFFAAQAIDFKATKIEITGEDSGRMTGDLTFRGKTHPVTLDVRFNGSMAEHPMDKKAHLGFSAGGQGQAHRLGHGFRRTRAWIRGRGADRGGIHPVEAMMTGQGAIAKKIGSPLDSVFIGIYET